MELTHVKGVFTSPITLSGIGQANDGQSVAGAGEEWLVTANGVDNGVWVTSLTGWTRRSDLDASGDFVWGVWLAVEGGNDFYGSTWYYNGIDNPTLGADTLYFNQRTRGYTLQDGEGLDLDPPFLNVSQSADEGEEDSLAGLRLVYVSATSLIVEAGTVWVPGAGAGGTGAFVTLEADTTLTGLSLGAAGLYHCYVYEANQTGAIEIASQVPETTPYFGGARVKGPDAGPDETRRYRASLYWTGSAIAKFTHRLPDTMVYDVATGASPYRVVSSGTPGATYATVSCSAVVPVSSRRAIARMNNLAGATVGQIGDTAGTVDRYSFAAGAFWIDSDLLLDASQAFKHRYLAGAPGSGLTVDVLGYRFEA